MGVRYALASLLYTAALWIGFLVLALVVVTKLTNPWHGLYFTATHAEVPFPHLALDYHPLYWASVGLAYALAAVGYFMLYDLFRAVGSGGGALGPLAGLTALPILFNGVGYASPSLLNVSHEPLGVAVFAIGVFYLYGEEFEQVRLAGEQEDPAFVLGEGGILREYNRSARALLPKEALEEGPLGRPIQEFLPEVAKALEKEEPTLRLEAGRGARYYQLGKAPLGSGPPGRGSPGRGASGDGPLGEGPLGKGGLGHFLVLTDVTEHKMREEALKEESAALRKVSRVTADPEASLEEKISRLLEVGREYLGVPTGFLAEISEDTGRVVSASGPNQVAEPGETFSISEEFCGAVMGGERPVVTRHDPTSGVEERVVEGEVSREKSPAREGSSAGGSSLGERKRPPEEGRAFGSYIGAKVGMGEEVYGAFCFGSPDPRSRPFSEREEAFVALLARWASYEIERRERTERLEHQNERLDRFASVLTHDLRNPLNVAQVRLTLALEELEGAAGPDKPADLEMLPDHLQSASSALGRMERLIEDTLALTWGEQGFEAEEMKEVSLADMAEDCWEQVDALEATLQVEGDLTFEAHEGRLQQLLENLFRNAAEHGGEAVTVTVGSLPEGMSLPERKSPSEEKSSEGDPKGFFVEDDGPGIPEEKRGKIFERGYSSEEEGTGLGLSIAEAIAEAHGWSISAAEGREGGARFEIRGTSGPGGKPDST
jgi:signal transduction histidine kinase